MSSIELYPRLNFEGCPPWECENDDQRFVDNLRNIREAKAALAEAEEHFHEAKAALAKARKRSARAVGALLNWGWL
jgi:hypothetical protein